MPALYRNLLQITRNGCLYRPFCVIPFLPIQSGLSKGMKPFLFKLEAMAILCGQRTRFISRVDVFFSQTKIARRRLPDKASDSKPLACKHAQSCHSKSLMLGQERVFFPPAAEKQWFRFPAYLETAPELPTSKTRKSANLTQCHATLPQTNGNAPPVSLNPLFSSSLWGFLG